MMDFCAFCHEVAGLVLKEMKLELGGGSYDFLRGSSFVSEGRTVIFDSVEVSDHGNYGEAKSGEDLLGVERRSVFISMTSSFWHLMIF